MKRPGGKNGRGADMEKGEMAEPVYLTKDGPIATVVFNRPEKHNALNVATKATVSFFFGSSMIGNVAFGGSIVAKKVGQLLSDWTLTVTRFCNVEKFEITSLFVLLFWMMTVNLPVKLVTPGLNVIFFGAFNFTTAKSCAMNMSVSPYRSSALLSR